MGDIGCHVLAFGCLTDRLVSCLFPNVLVEQAKVVSVSTCCTFGQKAKQNLQHKKQRYRIDRVPRDVASG